MASSEPSRNVRWEIYPSEVVSGVDVYKSQSADLVAGGVAGTIDIKTIRPLNYSGPELLVRGGGVYYEAGGDIPDYDPMGYRGSGSFTHTHRRQLRIQPGRERPAAEECVSVIPGLGLQRRHDQPRQRHRRPRMATALPNPTPWGAQTEVKKLTEDRFGVNGAIGWRVGDNFELNIDAMYSKFTIDEDQNQAWYGRNGTTGNWANGNAACYNDPLVRLHHRGRNRGRRDAPQQLLGVGHQRDREVHRRQGPARRWRQRQVECGNLDDQRRPVAFGSGAHQSLGGIPFRGLCPEHDLRHERGQHAVAAARPSIRADPATQSAPGWLTGISDGPDNLQDKLSAVRLDFTRDFEDKFHVAASARARRIAARTSSSVTRNTPRRSPATCRRRSSRSYSVTEFDAPPLLNGDFDELADFVYGGMPVDMDTVVQSSIWGVDESVVEGYVKIRFEGTIGSKTLNGNFGVRVVRTETESTGFGSMNGGALQPVTISNDYTEMLPSINFTFNLAEDTLMRVGLARVISRPPLDELRASRQLWNNTTRRRPAAAAIRCSIRSSPISSTCRSSTTSARKRWRRSQCSTRTWTATSVTPPNP